MRPVTVPLCRLIEMWKRFSLLQTSSRRGEQLLKRQASVSGKAAPPSGSPPPPPCRGVPSRHQNVCWSCPISLFVSWVSCWSRTDLLTSGITSPAKPKGVCATASRGTGGSPGYGWRPARQKNKVPGAVLLPFHCALKGDQANITDVGPGLWKVAGRSSKSVCSVLRHGARQQGPVRAAVWNCGQGTGFVCRSQVCVSSGVRPCMPSSEIRPTELLEMYAIEFPLLRIV